MKGFGWSKSTLMANYLIGRHKPHFQASIPTHDYSKDLHHHSELRPAGLAEARGSKKWESGKGAPVARKMDRETDLSRRRWQIEDGSLGGRLKPMSRVEGRGAVKSRKVKGGKVGR
jgi:hypothetical protein